MSESLEELRMKKIRELAEEKNRAFFYSSQAKPEESVTIFHPLRYRKRPIMVEAVQWKADNDGNNLAEMKEFCPELQGRYPIGEYHSLELDGMRAMPGDYVIKGVNGEYYPCSEDVFLKTYDVV